MSNEVSVLAGEKLMKAQLDGLRVCDRIATGMTEDKLG
jgi:hypothetical protein